MACVHINNNYNIYFFDCRNGRETAKWARDRTEEKQYLTKKKDLEFYKEDVENSFTIVFVQSDVVWLRSGSSSFLGSQQ